jgi:hypothetical protein
LGAAISEVAALKDPLDPRSATSIGAALISAGETIVGTVAANLERQIDLQQTAAERARTRNPGLGSMCQEPIATDVDL